MFTIQEFLLIQIRPNKVKVTDLKTGESLESSELTFGNDRLLITDMVEPESTLTELIKQLTKSTLVHFSRNLIINPYHPNISEFSEVEKRAFRDMAEALGARTVRFKFGENITIASLDKNYLDNETSV